MLKQSMWHLWQVQGVRVQCSETCSKIVWSGWWSALDVSTSNDYLLTCISKDDLLCPLDISTATLPWPQPVLLSWVAPTPCATLNTPQQVITTLRCFSTCREIVTQLSFKDCGEPRSESNTCRQRSNEDPQLSLNYGKWNIYLNCIFNCVINLNNLFKVTVLLEH